MKIALIIMMALCILICIFCVIVNIAFGQWQLAIVNTLVLAISGIVLSQVIEEL